MLKSLLRRVRRAPQEDASPDKAPPTGAQLLREGRLEEAERAFRNACAARPQDAEAWHALGYVLGLRRNHGGAIDAIQRALELAPDHVETIYSLASAYRAAGDYPRAIDAFTRLTLLKPDWYAPWASLGDIYSRANAMDRAEDMYRRALELAPDVAEIHSNFAKVLMECGLVDEGIARYRGALELKPESMRVYSSLLCAYNYSDRYRPEEVRDAHFEFDRRYAKALAPTGALPPGDPARRPLRIGYVSPDFRQHAVAALVEPALKHHDRERFTLHCYCDVAETDARTARLRRYAAVWRDIAGKPDETVTQWIRNDGIDILVDLTGHTDNHRLLVFARKPAPVQITWIGHPNTTGMTAMDYRITDRYADPPGLTEHLHSERLLRMPEIYLPFEAPDDPVEVTPLPCLSRGYVTFGSYNSFLKVNAHMIGVWSRILHAVPRSRLMAVTIAEGRTRARVREEFARHGISAARLDLRGRLAHPDFLRAHAEVDIALDTYPYHGTTTTAHTLWMGVPVVTLTGTTHLSRVGVSMLSNVGLADLIASTEGEYVERAAALARDTVHLRTLRSTLRGRMEAAPNMDGPRFARALEAAYTQVWEAYCSKLR